MRALGLSQRGLVPTVAAFRLARGRPEIAGSSGLCRMAFESIGVTKEGDSWLMWTLIPYEECK